MMNRRALYHLLHIAFGFHFYDYVEVGCAGGAPACAGVDEAFGAGEVDFCAVGEGGGYVCLEGGVAEGKC